MFSTYVDRLWYQRADLTLDIRTAATNGLQSGGRGTLAGERFALTMISLALDEVDAT